MARSKRPKVSDTPIDVDAIIAAHDASLREPNTRRVHDSWQDRYVDVTDSAPKPATLVRPEVPNRTHNTMSSRERRANQEAARAKPTGNRGGNSRKSS